MVEYSIAVCNYNMAETIERSIRSMLEQVDDRFEVVVVDGGSDDGSVEILDELAEEDDRLRVVSLEPDGDRHLGADRNTSFEASHGTYVYESLDADEIFFDGVIEDFAEIYRQIESQVDFEFYLSGTDINLAPKQLLLDIPYRNLKGAEDRDLARRLFAEDAIIWLDHAPVSQEIGYHMDLEAKLRRDLNVKVCDFQCGISFWSCIRWAFTHERNYVFEEERSLLGRLAKIPYDLVTFPLAYAIARDKPTYSTPSGFRAKGTLDRTVARERKTLSEIETAYDLTIDRDQLSENGRAIFDI